MAAAAPDENDRDRPDTLDERLDEEEPEAFLRPTSDAWAGQLVGPELGGGDVYRSEGDETDDADEPGAEEAAIHVRDEGNL